jgi:hypothetical protein
MKRKKLCKNESMCMCEREKKFESERGIMLKATLHVLDFSKTGKSKVF